MNPAIDYFKYAITVDNVIFGFSKGELNVLLIERGEEPFDKDWALPGYFVKQDEDLESAAYRVLNELTGLKDVYLEQVHSFGRVDRHPFGRVITVAFYSLIKIDDYKINAASIAKNVKWESVNEVLKMSLPFDHREILEACYTKLRKAVRGRPVGFELLPPKFTLTELQNLYEAILMPQKLDKRNFRKKILSMKLLIDLSETQEGVAHRPAKLFKFDRDKYKEFVSEGFVFDI